MTTITGREPGTVPFVGAGAHRGESPLVATVIRLGAAAYEAEIGSTVTRRSVAALRAHRPRGSFVGPVDRVNPDGVFPGDSYDTDGRHVGHAHPIAFGVHADAYREPHGGGIPVTRVPLTIGRAGKKPVAAQAIHLARVFGLPYIVTEDWWLYRSRMTFGGRLEKSTAGSILAGIPPSVARRTGAACAHQIVNDWRCGSPS